MLLDADSFEHYGTEATSRANMQKGAWIIEGDTSDGVYVTNAFAATGNNCLRFLPSKGNNRVTKLLPSPKSFLGLGFRAMFNIFNSGYGFTIRASNDDVLITARIQTNGQWNFVKGTFESGTFIGSTGEPKFTTNTFYHIEINILFDSYIGELEVRINGVQVLHVTDIDLGNIPASAFTFQTFSDQIVNANMYIDDVIWYDDNGDHNNTFIGPAAVYTVFATGEGTEQDWSVTGASAHAAVGEVPPNDDTSYVSSDSVGDKLDFTMPTLGVEIDNIVGVVIPALARTVGAGVGSLGVSMISDDTPLSPGAKTLEPSYAYKPFVFDFDPATELAWSKSSFEAAIVRIEKTA